jgi:hypothetical protein
LLIGRFQHLIHQHSLVNEPPSDQQLTSEFLRGDTHSTCCNH